MPLTKRQREILDYIDGFIAEKLAAEKWDLVINGVRVTNSNCRDYFELLHGVTSGKELVFE